MWDEDDKKMCQLIFDEGEVIRKEEFDYSGKHIEQFSVIYYGESYNLTKHDGEWIYLFHSIQKAK